MQTVGPITTHLESELAPNITSPSLPVTLSLSISLSLPSRVLALSFHSTPTVAMEEAMLDLSYPDGSKDELA
jgi:hypothetical protein